MDHNSQRFLVAVLPAIAARHGIAVEVFPHSADWIFRLSKEGVSRFLFGYDFGLNDATAMLVADDKCATYDALSMAGVACVEHVLFLNPALRQAYVGDKGNWPGIIAYLLAHPEGVVCKPNNGTGGVDVERANTMLELEIVVQRLMVAYPSVCLSPWLDVDHEYRCIVLNGAVELCYRKVRKEAEWRHNLALGAQPELADRPDVRELALRAADAIGLAFGSVDIVECGGEASVLEINSGVMMERFARSSAENRAIAEAIFDKAVAAIRF